jgi:hypothetical protein
MEFLSEVLTGLHFQAHPHVNQQIVQYAVLLLSILLSASGSLVAAMYTRDPEPYHTSALSSEG